MICPKFYEVYEDVLRFKYYQGSRKLPTELSEYLAKDERGNCDAFQLEHISANQSKKAKGPLQYMKEIKEMGDFRSKLMASLKNFDVEWESLKLS